MTVIPESLAEDNSPPVAVSFFDTSLKEVRRRVFYQWARTILILAIFIFAVLSLFWGFQYGTESNYTSLKVWIVDLDGQVDPYRSNDPIVGPTVTAVTRRVLQSSDLHLGYDIKSPSDFNYDPWAVRKDIYDEHAYAAVIIQPYATMLLQDAVSNGNTSYDPTGAIDTIIISARDESVYYSYIIPQLDILRDMVLAEFGPRWAREVVSSTTNLTSVPPQAINPAIGFTNVDLRPFAPAVATPAVTIGLIYLIIIAFFNFPFMMPVHAQFMKPGNPPLKVSHWLIWRILSSIVAYFFLSLCYSLVSLAFQIPLSNDPAPEVVSANNPNAYGRASFVVFWMLNWVGMAALGFPCENMAMVLGFPWSAFFLIFWVITNVATGFYAIDMAPDFYRWGYAWPLHRIVEAMRTILFDTHSRIGLDFAILFIWIAISLALYPFAAFVMKWKMKRGL